MSMEPTIYPPQPTTNIPTSNPISSVERPLNIFQRLLYIIVNGLFCSAIIYIGLSLSPVLFSSEFPLIVYFVILFLTFPLVIYLSSNIGAQKSNKIIKDEGSLIAVSFLFPIIVAFIEASICDDKFCILTPLIIITPICAPSFIVGFIYSLISKRPSKLLLYAILLVLSIISVYFMEITMWF